MDFIFMLTRDDRTVPDAAQIVDDIADCGIGHIGFKDVGADMETLHTLTQRIHNLGATAYLEVVSETPETIRESLKAAAALGVDRVLGGQDVSFARDVLTDSSAGYYPFPGIPSGHPTVLGGSPGKIEADCARAMAAGAKGVDLLAYRATEADPLDLIRAARRGVGNGYLVVAGSIDTPERIRAVADAGADAFTIGTAIFEGRFAPGASSVRAQCEVVLGVCEKI